MRPILEIILTGWRDQLPFTTDVEGSKPVTLLRLVRRSDRRERPACAKKHLPPLAFLLPFNRPSHR